MSVPQFERDSKSRQTCWLKAGLSVNWCFGGGGGGGVGGIQDRSELSVEVGAQLYDLVKIHNNWHCDWRYF